MPLKRQHPNTDVIDYLIHDEHNKRVFSSVEQNTSNTCIHRGTVHTETQQTISRKFSDCANWGFFSVLDKLITVLRLREPQSVTQ